MTNKYDIDSLIETFEQHAAKAEKDRLDLIESFIKKNDPVPRWLYKDFSISKALLAICQEIKALKKGIKHE